MESTTERSMDTFSSFRGYGKMSESEEREYRRRSRNRRIIIWASSALLLLIIVVSVAAVVAQKRRNDDPNAEAESTSSASTIRAACDSTLYPDSCYSSLTAAADVNNNTNSPEDLFKISLRVALDALRNATPLPDILAKLTDDKAVVGALNDCKEMLDDAIDLLNDSIESVRTAGLTRSKISALRSWLSATITNQVTCLDGFANTTGEVVDRMSEGLRNSTRYTSNSLAIVTKVVGVLHDLGVPLRRKLLGTEVKKMEDSTVTTASSGTPMWISGQQRRMMMKRSSRGLKPDVTVAKDGSGDVRTINEAVAMVRKKSTSAFVIYVKQGVYDEIVKVDKVMWNVVMYGDGMYNTFVTGSLNFVDGVKTFHTATFTAAGKRFTAMDMGFQNTAGPHKDQAVAVRAASDFALFFRCSFVGFQDTLYAYSLRQYYRECDIVGTVDFIFGDASAVFQDCNILPREPLPGQQNTITAQGRSDPNENTGIAIHECSIAPYGTVTAETYLGRPWMAYATTVIMESNISGVVHPAGWMEWESGVVPPNSIYYAEFRNAGPGSGTHERVTWAGYHSSISRSAAEQYGVESFIQGSEWLPATGVRFDGI